MTDLSPAAQAVLDAYFTHADLLNRKVSHEEMIAAALRALADQVVPQEPYECKQFTNEAVRLNRMGTRSKLLAIATELRELLATPPPEPPTDEDLWAFWNNHDGPIPAILRAALERWGQR